MKRLIQSLIRSTVATACVGALSFTAAAYVAPNVPAPPAAVGAPQGHVKDPPVVRTVTTTDDSGPGSLRQALADAGAGDTINFALTWPAVIEISNTLAIDKDVMVLGPGPEALTVMRVPGATTPSYRIFLVNSEVFMSGLTIRNGRALNDTGTNSNLGGGILNWGSLTVSNCVLTENVAPTENGGNGFGGAIFSLGPLTVLNSTIHGNEATYAGGGICTFHVTNFLASGCTISRNLAGIQGGGLNFQGYDGLIQNCTISGNVDNNIGNQGGGGGVVNIGYLNEVSTLVINASTITRNTCDQGAALATVQLTGCVVTTQLKNTIVAGNVGPNFLADGGPTVQSLGHTIDSDGTSGFVNGVNGDIVGTAGSPVDALLGPRQDNGGPTLTHMILPGSPALDAADCATPSGGTLTIDQRGYLRPQGPACDIGAVENQPPFVHCPEAQRVECTSSNGTPVRLSATVGDPDGDALVVVWWIDGAPYKTNLVAATHPPARTEVKLTATLPLGTHPISVWVSDLKATPMSCSSEVTVRDTTPPKIVSIKANPDTLWPPSHKMVPVQVVVRATDACSPVRCKIVSVRSNEPVNGKGDGNTSPDWIITGNLSLMLRAERSGNSHGRIYTITVECSDKCGNTSKGTVTVTVDKSRSDKQGRMF